jgi:hypothetical protein
LVLRPENADFGKIRMDTLLDCPICVPELRIYYSHIKQTLSRSVIVTHLTRVALGVALRSIRIYPAHTHELEDFDLAATGL